MKSKIAFTKKDLAVALVCLVFLLMSLGAIGSGGRERAKRAVCLSNLKQLSLAWHQYADDNDGRIVNGAPLLGEHGYCHADPPQPSSDDYTYHKDEKPWVGVGRRNYVHCTEDAIRDGALWPYCKNLKLYRCPAGQPREMLTYSIMDGMNGLTIARTGFGSIYHKQGYWIKKLSEISDPPPAKRMVFIDEGFLTPDSFGVHYSSECWFDNPPSRHSDGVNVSFADGHSEHRKWKGMWTIIYARVNGNVPTGELCTVPGAPIDMTPGDVTDNRYKYVPATCDDYEDLQYIQKGCWGGIGYDPTCP